MSCVCYTWTGAHVTYSSLILAIFDGSELKLLNKVYELHSTPYHIHIRITHIGFKYHYPINLSYPICFFFFWIRSDCFRLTVRSWSLLFIIFSLYSNTALVSSSWFSNHFLNPSSFHLKSIPENYLIFIS